MKFLVSRASGGGQPIPEAVQDGYISRFHAPGYGNERLDVAYYIEIETLEQLQQLIDREGGIVIDPLPFDDPEDYQSRFGSRPYGCQASYELTIHDDYIE